MNLILIAFLEGFVTLAVELVAIRISIPIVGSSMVLTGMLLGIILLSLSAGYWSAGKLSSTLSAEQIPARLQSNFLKAAFFYLLVTFPLHGLVMELTLPMLNSITFSIFMTSLLYVYPVWVASQTIPLLTQLDRAESAGEKSGKMLFFSTVGSMLGSTLTPILLFPHLGVQFSSLALVLILILCAVMTRLNPFRWKQQMMTGACLGLLLFIGLGKEKLRDRYETPYQTMIIERSPQKVSLRSGTLYSSVISLPDKTPQPAYAKEAVRLMQKDQKVLMLGAAGFTIAQELARHSSMHITTVDVDGAVKDVAEKHFLQEPLKPNISFHPESARFFVQRTSERYDHTLVDAYFSLQIPLELATVEFYQKLKQISKRVTLNMIGDPNLKVRYTQRLLTTFKQVFPEAHYRAVQHLAVSNMMVTSQPEDGYQKIPDFQVEPYTDDNSNADEEILALSHLREARR